MQYCPNSNHQQVSVPPLVLPNPHQPAPFPAPFPGQRYYFASPNVPNPWFQQQGRSYSAPGYFQDAASTSYSPAASPSAYPAQSRAAGPLSVPNPQQLNTSAGSQIGQPPSALPAHTASLGQHLQPAPRRFSLPPGQLASPASWSPLPSSVAPRPLSESPILPQQSPVMASSGSGVTPSNFNDFDAVMLQVGRNTVERLKRIIRHINDNLNMYLKYGGLKAQLIEQVKTALTSTRANNQLVAYGIIRQAIYNPDSIGQTHSYGSSAPSASTSYSAPGGSNGASYATPASYAYSRPGFGLGISAPKPTSAASAAALARSYPPAPSSLPPPRPVPGPSSAYSPQLPQQSAQPAAVANAAPGLPIDFRTNPFLTLKCALSSVVTCPRTSAGERKSVTAAFNLTPDQRQMLSTARESDKNPQYQVRVYACSETYYSVPISSYYQTQPSQPLGPAPVEFPMQSEVRINNVGISANLRGVKKKEGTVMPPNVGAAKNNFGTNALNLAPSARNSVDLVYVNTEKRFFIIVCLVQYHPATDLLKQVKDAPPKSKESVIADIIEANKDEDIVATSAALSLRCPLSFMRLKEPIRSKSCSHIQCFEASTWFAMNEQTPTWNCPQCNKVVKIADLFIDDFTRNILATVPEKYDSVIVEPDATWYTEDNKFGTSSKVGQAPPAPATAAKEEASPEPAKRESSSSTRPIQILDSDDDDVEGPSVRPKTSSNGFNGMHHPSPRRPPPARGAVIDLTLSDDDDDAEPQPTASASGAVNGHAVNSDSGAQKRARDEDWGSPAGAPPGSRPRLEDVW